MAEYLIITPARDEEGAAASIDRVRGCPNGIAPVLTLIDDLARPLILREPLTRRQRAFLGSARCISRVAGRVNLGENQ